MTFWLNLYQSLRESSRLSETTPKGVDVKKYDSCVNKVAAKGKVDSPWAVCAAQLKKEADSSGVKTKSFWASALDNPNPKPKVKKGVTPSTITSQSTGDEEALDIILQNPGISGATLLNTLKSKGLAIVDTKPETGGSDETKEADSSSSNTPSVRTGVGTAKIVKNKKQKEAGIKEITSGNISFRTNSFIESVQRPDDPYGLLFKTILIQEGLGNLTDRFYYTRKSLESALPIFEGKKIYANHPSALEEQTRPERDVRDVLGHFENVQITEDEDGRAQLVADLVILPEQPFDWARGLMKHAVGFAKKYPDKEFVGLSINASGDAQEISLSDYMEKNKIPDSSIPKLQKAIDQGVDKIRVVNQIESAVSCDLVTEAGAGGKILKLIEEEKVMAKKVKEAAQVPPAKESNIEAEDETNKEDGKDDGGDGGHDDAGQDKKLIKSMIKKHMGDDSSEEDEGMVQQAYEAYKEMGYGESEAAEAAATSMRLAKHMKQKQAEAENEDENEAEDAKVDKKGYSYSFSQKSEADKKDAKILALQGRVAMLESRDNKRELEAHLETILKESKLPMSVTKTFREAVGKPKTKDEVNSKFKIFVEAYKAAGGEANNYVVSTEKNVGETGRTVSFADCKND